MELNEFQKKAKSTAIYPKTIERYHNLVYPALGLAGEAGEVAEKIKKLFRKDNELTSEKKEEIAKELGDVLWYIAMLADELGYTLEDIAEKNALKLSERQKNGRIHGDGDNR